jgi:hypothetical protein
MANDLTDYQRWKDSSQLRPAWEPRAKAAARFIQPGKKVMDLGCGNMAIERYLPVDCGYIPVDLVSRDSRTVVCNFNRGEFPEKGDAQLIICLGLLEYMVDIESFIERLSTYELPVILSYAPTDLTEHIDRQSAGWLNHLDANTLRNMIAHCGFKIQSESFFQQFQILLVLDP